MSHTERVVILVDMDCFYCQVEENLNPELAGKPIAVVQYNAWRGGGIIAVNYPARDRGVTRHMRGDEAKEKCPEIELVKVPNVRGKADLSKYRDAGKRVADVLQIFTPLLERASVDEAYLDVTNSVCSRMEYLTSLKPEHLKNTHVVGCTNVEEFLESFKDNEYVDESNLRLAIGGAIAEEIRAAVYERTGYRCSAGIAHNKILAKLVCGLHKPNQQTILPQDGVAKLYENLPLRKIKSLGGKFGNYLSEKLKINNMGELSKFTERELAKHFDEKSVVWLYNIARGIDREPVTVRLISKTIGCCKKFPGRNALISEEDVKHWLYELAEEVSERLTKDIEENNRKAKQLVISFVQEMEKKDVSSSRSHPLNSYETDRIMADAYEVIKKNCMRSNGKFCVKFLGISAGKFEDVKNLNDISTFFKNVEPSRSSLGGKQKLVKGGKMKSSIKSFFKPVEGKIEGVSKNESDGSEDSNSCFGKECGEDVKLVTGDEIGEIKEEIGEESSSNSVFGKYLNRTCKDKGLEEEESVFDKQLNEGLETKEEQCSVQKLNVDCQTNSFFGQYFNKSSENEQSKSNFDDGDSQSSLIPNKYDSQVTNSCQENKLSNNQDEDCESDDSISQELQPETTDSYFQKCFALMKENRVFNTSIALEDPEVRDPEPSTSETMELCTECSQEVPCSEILTHMDKHISEETINEGMQEENYLESQEIVSENVTERKYNFGDEDGKEVCVECGKRILVCDMISHMDYHFALKMVKEEADIYKTAKTMSIDSKKKGAESKENKSKKASKRKVEEKVKNSKLTSFLIVKPEVNDNVPMETCAECKRKIRVDEFVDHMDFHVAKKIHMEINSVGKSCDNVSKSSFKGSKSNGKVGKSKSVKNSSSLKSVSSFFKPV